MRRLSTRTLRLVAAALVAVGLAALPSHAEPSRANLDAARARLHEMNQNLSLLVEQYDQAKLKLAETQHRLDQAQAEVEDANAAAAIAQERFGERAAVAYQAGLGTGIGALLNAENFGDFTYRLEFMSRVAEKDQDLATQAQITGQEAEWAADDYAEAKQEQQAALENLNERTADLKSAIAAQEALVERYEIQYQNALAAERQAERQAENQSSAIAAPTGGGGYSSPSVSGGVGAVIAAARSVLGAPYKWGGASPAGFDCSGLTMWAWAHAGVSLPHSSAAQYAALPHVSKSDLQAGDLVFFYNPIHHVGLYIGGGQMIHAYSSGSPVSIDSVFGGHYGSVFVGAARPG
jgi:cell wall-associated NlpC family hydrolase